MQKTQVQFEQIPGPTSSSNQVFFSTCSHTCYIYITIPTLHIHIALTHYMSII